MKQFVLLKYPNFSNGRTIGEAISRRYGLDLFDADCLLKVRQKDGEAKDLPVEEVQPSDESIAVALGQYLMHAPIIKGLLFGNFLVQGVKQARILDAVLAQYGHELTALIVVDPGEDAIREGLETYLQARKSVKGESGDPKAHMQQYDEYLAALEDLGAYYGPRGIAYKVVNWADVEAVLGK